MLELNKANFDAEVKEADKPVFIDFWSDGWGKCIEMMPGVHQLEEKYADKIKFASFNIAEGRRIAMKLKVLGLPACKIVKAGEIVAGIGPEEATSVEAIEAFIKEYYETV